MFEYSYVDPGILCLNSSHYIEKERFLCSKQPGAVTLSNRVTKNLIHLKKIQLIIY